METVEKHNKYGRLSWAVGALALLVAMPAAAEVTSASHTVSRFAVAR